MPLDAFLSLSFPAPMWTQQACGGVPIGSRATGYSRLARPTRTQSGSRCRKCREASGDGLGVRVFGAAVTGPTASEKTAKRPSFPFCKIAGQDDMKLALLLNIVDRKIGGVLIMGDRGTGKSMAVRGGFFGQFGVVCC